MDGDQDHLGAPTQASLASDLANRIDGAQADPFTNPFLLFALDLTRRITDEILDADRLDAVLSELTQAAFAGRAERLGRYLGDSDPNAVKLALAAMFERLAEGCDIDAFARVVGETPFGIVLTAHPTFALSLDRSRLLIELATGWDAQGQPLTDGDRRARLDRAAGLKPGPADVLTLDVEHDWSVLALQNVHDAMARVYAVVFRVARRRWPERWTTIRPRLLTLATWVGFDQDGRTDVTWQVSLGKRLALKRLALEARLSGIEASFPNAAGDGPWRAALEALGDRLRRAIAVVDHQVGALAAAQADPARLGDFAREMVEGRDEALVDTAPLLALLEAAVAAAPDDAARKRLLILRSGVETEGVSLARIHVRLNAGQLHNAIRPQVGLHTSPTDPANRRTYFAAIEALIEHVEPVRINFGDLASEPASAPRLMMTVAQMLKYVDGSTPVRFLIAETEAGFTLLAALYFARLFGVADQVEISPLFETEEAFERGEQVIEEALRSPVYREHLIGQGRLAIEFGFSDSGRFIGQMAATFRIERLRLRLVQMLEGQGLTGLEVIFFNTHGESIGRGGHPASLSDRFRYAAPPHNRGAFAERGVRIREEDAFQGGEGYLPLLSPCAALATVSAALQSVIAPDPEAVGDPIYDDPAFASEFFATVQQDFTRLAADPDYAALLGLFATHLLPKTGSRPVQRQAGDGGVVRKLKSVSELRAIPNNALLQQLGFMANTLYGVGHAAEKDPTAFAAMREGSARFRRALDMAARAYRASDLRVVSAYCAIVDPALWLDRAQVDPAASADLKVSEVAAATDLAEPLTRLLRRLQLEDLRLRDVLGGDRAEPDGGRRDRLLLLHAVRLGLIQRLCLLAVGFPSFNPRGEVTQATLQQRLMRLDVPAVLQTLAEIFPRTEARAEDDIDFVEPTTYAPGRIHAYRETHEAVFTPMARLYGQMLTISAAITDEIGAFG